MDKTRHLRTSSWPLGNTDPHFSEILDSTNRLNEKIIHILIDKENNPQHAALLDLEEGLGLGLTSGMQY